MRGPVEPMSEKDSGETPPEDAMQDMIGKQLRHLYDSVLVEPIPDRIVELLLRLDDVEPAAERNDAQPTSKVEPDNDNSTERQ